MQVFTALVRRGAIVPDEGLDLPEGARVTVIAEGGETPLALTPEQEAELVASIAEADNGKLITTEELFRRLKR
jgi:hypothetical protein